MGAICGAHFCLGLTVQTPADLSPTLKASSQADRTTDIQYTIILKKEPTGVENELKRAYAKANGKKKEGAMKRFLLGLLCITVLLSFLFSCTPVIYVPKGPPPRKVEVKSPPPGAKAIWVEGHWKWTGSQYVWVPGHWVKKPKGQWVAGHWKKTPHGWKWKKGHWKP
jgi:hypothetical protein